MSEKKEFVPYDSRWWKPSNKWSCWINGSKIVICPNDSDPNECNRYIEVTDLVRKAEIVASSRVQREMKGVDRSGKAKGFRDNYPSGGLRGELKITKEYADGRKEVVVEDSNLVVTVARQTMAHIIALGDDDATPIYRIADMKFGDGGHNPGDGLYTPDVSDTDIAGTEIITKSVSYEFPTGATSKQVTFRATILQSEANGAGSNIISEAVLRSANNDAFARKTFGPITKTSDFELTFAWTIVF